MKKKDSVPEWFPFASGLVAIARRRQVGMEAGSENGNDDGPPTSCHSGRVPLIDS